MNSNLIFNILTFDFPKENPVFYFSDTDIGKCQKIHKSIFPNEIKRLFPNIGLNGNNFVYTTFTGKTEGYKPLTINFKTENHDFLKRYYNRQINHYFRVVKEEIVKANFIKDNQVWLLNSQISNNQYDVYDKFTLKIQIAVTSKHPEIVLSYDGISKVFKQSIAELINTVSPTCFNWVKKDNQLQRWDTNSLDDNPDYSKYFPVLNNTLRNALGIEADKSDRGNRYTKYLDKITTFYKTYLNTKEFKQIIPINCDSFISVSPSRIDKTSANSNLLQFNTNSAIAPHEGLKRLKPFKSSPYKNIHLFYIFHIDDYTNALKINECLTNGFKWFKGLQQYANILFHVDKNLIIKFTNKDNPLPEIETILQERDFRTDVKYIAIYVTPYSKTEHNKQKREIYYKVKEMLLKRNITSQAIDPTKMLEQGDNWVYSLPNIAVAILAKLDGIPWRLQTQEKNELIIGVGAFKHIADNIQYIGSAFSFANNGKFNSFDYFMKHEIEIFAGKIANAVRKYATNIEQPNRLIIHFYKTMNEEEIQYIEDALHNLELSIPVFIISINKTESENIVAFDKDWQELMPQSGTYINIGRNKYLLFNNTRYSNASISGFDGYPFPIKLAIDCTDKEQLTDETVIRELIDQVYQFSRMYWKSVRQQNLPVTIKYPEIVAQVAPHFDGNDIPQYGKNNLWFL